MTDHGAPGLTDDEAAAVRARVGPNTVPRPRPPAWWVRVAEQLRDPMILLLLVAAAIAVAMGDAPDAAVVGVVVLLNTAVGVGQQVRAERALGALRALSAPTATVTRGGATRVLPAAEVVPGDVLRLAAGDVVPADAAVVRAHGLQVDESALTGESVPVDRRRTDEVAAGTVITRGRGTAVVSRTGADSALGRIAALLTGQRPRPTPLQRRLAELGRVLALAAVALSAVVAVIGLARGEPLAAMALTAISLAVAAVPESLPAVVTLALALGAHRMARRRAVVRSLPAVETLGSVTVLATDKTGTLTEGRMVAERLWVPGAGEFTVTGRGYDPVGEVRPGPPPEDLLRAIVLCNDADLRPPSEPDGPWRPVGDPMEAALLALAGKCEVDAAAVRARYPRSAEVPFDSDRKRMTTVHRAGEEWLVLGKGAPEVLLSAEEEAVAAADDLARAGYRVLAVTQTRTRGPAPDPRTAERGARLLGLVAIADPPRASSAEVVGTLKRAGIDLVMITGDHPSTAAAIARRVGITAQEPDCDAGPVGTGGAAADRAAIAVPGSAGPGTGGADVGQAVAGPGARSHVYARTRPERKPAIVRAWQEAGHVVAMTGDGVNDAPALRRADIGVAMGGGTEVARQAADLVLTDDDLGTVAAAVEEGRRIHANVRTFLRYAVSGGAAEVLVMLLGPLLGLAVPLLPGQILWINLLTHGLPGVALGAEPAAPGLMRARPRPPAESILGAGLWHRIAWTGALIAAATLGVGLWVAHTGGPWQTAVFLTLGLAQLGTALALRRPGRRPRFLDLAVAGALALQLAALFLRPLRDLLNTEPLVAADVVPAVLAAAVPGIAVRLAGRLKRG
ncbi:cation-translocating P-type ATPase [Actinokineospora enzanensis]|uniref:cation-translocating P-type ATPase n=1 Tax=Actinokineospora enzanensis TaxID=155975 RepID=UPI001B7F7D04|nr:cation-transporting P-type ATPase [Actinokineospora enzanensis]